jgi:hypothetical protein
MSRDGPSIVALVIYQRAELNAQRHWFDLHGTGSVLRASGLPVTVPTIGYFVAAERGAADVQGFGVELLDPAGVQLAWGAWRSATGRSQGRASGAGRGRTSCSSAPACTCCA